ncbi:hypothetical protein RO3G_15232 [Lichtheimia corymbifera JMRC:FSU:9682]|uniref:Uncharacterized protein n=1 Tax=Lichtheimia corymbifera JMRC:FSU:9682 TaxID=1263082 RepID=A0A068S321_9FUNG|nr:hypothetical protein RO3G_15232 [Lichtheimia corymbifera JMRC:FSU:9682]
MYNIYYWKAEDSVQQQVPAAAIPQVGQPMGIFPESQRRVSCNNNEEWRVGGRARESWKVALPQQQQPKPLPQEPPAPPPRRSFVQQQHHDPYYGYDWSAAPIVPHQFGYYTDEPMSTESDTTQELPTPELHADPSPPASSSSTSSAHYGPPSLPTEQQQPTEKKKTSKPEDNTRQITVQSINKEHMVWIKIDTTETGLSLANKIHTIATFRTRKIVSITTAAGRTIPLDHRPVFGSWMDMDDFKNGEEWKVEWCELDKGLVDRLVSKFIQVRERQREWGMLIFGFLGKN